MSKPTILILFHNSTQALYLYGRQKHQNISSAICSPTTIMAFYLQGLTKYLRAELTIYLWLATNAPASTEQIAHSVLGIIQNLTVSSCASHRPRPRPSRAAGIYTPDHAMHASSLSAHSDASLTRQRVSRILPV